MKEYIKKSELTDYIDGLTDDELVSKWNTYCQEQGYEDEIYENDEEFFEMFLIEAVRACSYGNYSYSDGYVVFNRYANLDSFSNLDDNDCPIDKQELISYIEENPEEFDIEFDEEDDEEDDEDLINFVIDSYDKVKAIWKKSPKNYNVWQEDDGTYTLSKLDFKGDGVSYGNLKELMRKYEE